MTYQADEANSSLNHDMRPGERIPIRRDIHSKLFEGLKLVVLTISRCGERRADVARLYTRITRIPETLPLIYACHREVRPGEVTWVRPEFCAHGVLQSLIVVPNEAKTSSGAPNNALVVVVEFEDLDANEPLHVETEQPLCGSRMSEGVFVTVLSQFATLTAFRGSQRVAHIRNDSGTILDLLADGIAQ